MEVTRIHHDPLCPVCGPDCSCDHICLCDFIADVRDDERRILAPYMRAATAVAADNRP